MTSIDAIIRANGGYERLREHPITVERQSFMPLHIEYIGSGPRGGDRIAVHHTYEQNGDLMFDPEVTFEVIDGKWHPLTFEMSGQCYWEAVFRDAGGGKLMCRPKLLKDLKEFCRVWNRNIREQGFVASAAAA